MAIGELFTPDDVAVIATPQAVVLQAGITYTLRNTDSTNSLWWISKPSVIAQSNTSTFAGEAGALKTAGGSEIVAGSQTTLRNAPPFIHVVCATGLTATLKIDIAETEATVVVTGAVVEASAADIKTAVQLIDDAIYVDDADWTDSTSKHALVGGLYQSSQQSITDGDVGPIQVDPKGNQVMVGLGVAGTPAGGVVTVQGVGSMTPLLATVTGAVTTSGTVTEASAADIRTAVQALALPLTDTWPKKVATGASALLSASLTFPAGTFRLTVVPHGVETIYIEKTTAASATSPVIPSGGISFLVTKAVADALAVMSTNASALSVYLNQ